MTQRVSRGTFSAAVARAAALLLFVTIVGCGGPKGGEIDRTDTDWVIGSVTSVSGAAGESGRVRWDKLFVQGAAPSDAERARYAALTFGGDYKKITMSGAEATATITITKTDDNSPVGEIEWEFAKEGAIWKIKSAPLPDGA